MNDAWKEEKRKRDDTHKMLILNRHELEVAREEVERTKSEAEVQLTLQRQTIENQNSDIYALRNQLQEKSDLNDVEMEKTSELNLRHQEVLQELKDLKLSNGGMSHRLREACQELENKLHESKEEAAFLRGKTKAQQHTVEQLQELIDKAEISSESYRKHALDLAEQNAGLEAVIGTMQQPQARYTEQVQKLECEIEKLRGECRLKDDKVATLETHLQNSREQSADAEKSMEKLITSHQQHLAQLKEESQELQCRIVNQEINTKNVRAQLVDVTATKNEAITKLEEVHRKLAEAGEKSIELAEKVQDYDKLRNEIAVLQSKISGHERQSNKIVRLEEEKKNLAADLEKVRGIVKRMTERKKTEKENYSRRRANEVPITSAGRLPKSTGPAETGKAKFMAVKSRYLGKP